MLGDKLRILRIKNNITQKQLAIKLSITQQAIAKWESGKAEPDISFINKLSIIFNCNPNYLLGNTDNPFLPNTNPTEQEALELLATLAGLPPDGQKQLKEYLNLLKIKAMQDRNIEIADELSIKE